MIIDTIREIKRRKDTLLYDIIDKNWSDDPEVYNILKKRLDKEVENE